MANKELNTKGIVDSIDNFNRNSEQICETLNGLTNRLQGYSH